MKFTSEFRRLIEICAIVHKTNSFRRRFAMALVFAFLCLTHAARAAAQDQTDTPPLCGEAGSAAQQQEDSPAPPPASTTGTAGTPREATWHKLPGNFLKDQKDMWLFPVKLGKGHYWLPTAFVVGGTAALIATDPQTMPHFRDTTTFHGFNRVFTSTVSGGIIAAVPATFYVASLIRKNSYDQGSALLAGEAVVDDTVLMVVIKSITQRLRPTDVAPTGNFSDTFFQSSKSPIGKGTSFPSGHAMMSFSVATVFARRYRQHRWIPYVAYGLASVISFSRVTTGAHFPSDVFMGAALGYVIARYDVVRQ
jgi:membrane-associated phospholipid phosphatase